MRWWTPVSAFLAPVALIGSWTVAAARRPDFHSARGTISALAAVGAPQRWIVTAGFIVTGACHLFTAAGLSEARPRGRVLLALGGVATLAVAAFPLPAAHGASVMHTISATTAFVALSAWPGAAVRSRAAAWSGAAVHPGRRAANDPFGRGIGCCATAILMATLGAFVIALAAGRYVGLAERVTAATQVLWPMAAVAFLRVNGATTHSRPRLG